MTCPRCKGTVGREYDFGAAEYDYVCLNCGWRVVICDTMVTSTAYKCSRDATNIRERDTSNWRFDMLPQCTHPRYRDAKQCRLCYDAERREIALQNLGDRFWSKVQKTESCWLWQAKLDHHGYGKVCTVDGWRMAHRVAYELAVGPIPDGLVIDHLCRTPRCVNPGHMEPVTMRENTLRGIAPTAIRARVTECPRGHQYNEENTYRRKGGSRECRLCHRLIQRERTARPVVPLVPLDKPKDGQTSKWDSVRHGTG